MAHAVSRVDTEKLGHSGLSVCVRQFLSSYDFDNCCVASAIHTEQPDNSGADRGDPHSAARQLSHQLQQLIHQVRVFVVCLCLWLSMCRFLSLFAAVTIPRLSHLVGAR